MTHQMSQAQREILRLSQQFATAPHGQVSGGVDRYAEQYIRELDAIIARHGAKKEVVKVFENGLKRIRITDNNGDIVTEYTTADA